MRAGVLPPSKCTAQIDVLSSSSDLAFDVQGYAFILLNDAFTAASNVYTKKNLGTEVKLCILSSQPPLCRNKGRRTVRECKHATRASERTHTLSFVLTLGLNVPL